MVCDFRTFSVLQGSFLFPVLLTISLFSGIYSQTSIPGNPNLAGDYEKNEGETVTLSCSAIGGNPLPSVQWYKNQQLVDPGSSSSGNGDGIYTVGSSTVTYNNYTFTVSRSDNLVSYICKVQNSLMASPLERAWTISIYVPSEQPFISGPDPAITTALNSGSTYKYVCTAQNGRPAPNLRWKLGTSLLSAVEFHQGITENTTTNADSTLSKSSTLSWVPIVDDNGKNLYCQTDQTTAGAGAIQKSTSVPIVVQQIPILQIGSSSYTTQVGSSVTLSCRVISATPAITDLFWRKQVNGVYTRITIDNNRFFGGSISNANLTISNVALSDQTSYQCSATNSAGTGNSGATTLSVSGSAPLVQIDQDKYPSTSGNTVTLVCDVYSSLTVSEVYWQRAVGGQFTRIDVSGTPEKYGGVTVSSPSLVVKSVTTGDAGEYRCVAVNIAGTGQDTTILEVQGNLPRVTIEKDSYTVNEGNAVTLACTVLSSTSSNVISVLWQTIENGVSSTLNVNDPSKYSGASVSNPSLTIFNAESSDNGQYRCTATNTVGTGESAITTLKVIAKPVFRITQNSYTVNYGTNVTLQVTISSPDAPVLAVNWQHTSKAGVTNYVLVGGGKYDGATVGSPSLKILSSTFEDEGTYRCLVTSSAGSTTSGPISLTVIGNVPSVVIGSGSAVVYGGQVTISCSISSNPSAQSMSWQKTLGGVTTTLDIGINPRYQGGTLSNPSLTISNVNLDDKGDYRCLATNIVGTGQSGPAVIDVTGGVPTVTTGSGSTVYVGDNATVTCIVSGTPAAISVSWQRTINSVTTTVNLNNFSKYSGGTLATPSLSIFNVSKEDEGSYSCQATNVIGTGQSVTSAFLSVIGSAPVTIIGPDISVTVGDQATISCSVTGYPLSTAISWQRIANGVRSNVDTSQARFSGGTVANPSLTINPVEGSDEGDYQCSATNYLGTSQSGTAFLDVMGSIPSVQIPSSSYTVAYSSQIRLQCVVNSIPPATSIGWIKTQQGVTTTINVSLSKYSGGTISDPSLRIYDADLSDEGSYVCSATNIVGTGTSQEMSLSVVVSLPTVQVGSSGYSGITGGTVTLVCSIISSNPSANSVIWEKDVNGFPTDVTTLMASRISGSTVTQPSLTISSLTAGDTGTYYCSAANSVGRGSRSSTTLTVQNVPAVSVSQTSYSIFVGSSVTLNCFVSGNPAVSFVFWTVTRNGFTQNAQDSRYSNGDINNPSLTINNARQSDTGVFICKAQNSAGTTDSSPVSLTVSGTSPNVTMAQSSYSVLTNGDVTLSCFVSANPSASISWTFTSNSGSVTAISASTTKYSLATSTTASSLTVRSANSNDQGSYRCSATNAVGTGQATAILVVSGSLPSINLPSTYSVITGNDITMTCSVSANPAVNSVFWQFRAANGFSFTNITATFKYSISSLTGTSSLTVRSTTSSDNGQYRCQATNQVGTSQSTTVLTVSGSVPVVNIPQNSYSSVTGQDVQIPCSVSANPTATITWTFISTSQSQTSITTSTSKYTFNPSSTDGTLRIRSTSSSDTGTYRCQATNAVGTSSDSASLSVSGSPPSVNFGSSSYSVTTGQSIQLVCFVSASPTATDIAWTFQSNTGGGTTTITSSTSGYSLTTTTSNTQSTLTVLSAQSSNGGTYTCRATNLVGTRSASVSLSVSGNIPTVTIPQNSYSVVTGQDVQIPCSVSASPSASISWIFISTSQSQITISSSTFKYTFNPSSTDGTLTVRTTTSGDTGTYRCQATNAVGTASDSATLSVSGSLPLVTIPQNSYSVVTGQDVQIPCSVSANPSASISWIFTSTSQSQITISSSTSKYTFNPTSTDGALRIRSTSSSDTGTYRCQATNAVGTSSDSATLSVTGSAPSVNFGSSSYSVTTGQSIQMVCFVSASPTATDIAWTFQSNTGGGTTTITSSTSGYSLTTTTSNTQSTLTVLSAQSSNGGTYTCRATNLVGTRSASASLSVSGNIPTVTIPQNSYSVVTGQDVQIPCSVSASPSASISWIFISTSQSQITISSSTFKYTFNPTSTDGTLTVRSTTSSDTGTYRCQATNAVGTASDSASLSVSGSLPSVTITQTTYSVITGSNQQIPCFVSANPTASAIGWTFRSATSGTTVTITSSTSGYSIVTSSTSQSTLTILAADNNDEGTYTCQATNQVGNGSDSAFLDVTGSRPTVNIQQNTYSSVSGQDVTISCVVSSNPTASISWIFISTGNSQTQITTSNAKYSLTTSSGGSTIVVRNSNSGDSGTYRCTATNTVGSASDSASLTVSGSLPVVNIPSSIYTVVTGQDATIPCSVSANPAVTSSSWTFISASSSQTMITQSTSKYTLSTSSGNMTLVVRGTSSADSGTYRCSATNAEGTASDQTSLTVSGSTPVVDISQNSYTAITGNNVVIPCTVSASPAATSISWRFTSSSGSEIQITSSSSKYSLSGSNNFPQLTILSVGPSDSGTYRCSATNLVGTSSDTASLTVTGSRPVVTIPSTNYNVVVGNSVTLPCTISASPSVTAVSWFFTSNSNNQIQIMSSSIKYTVSRAGSEYNLTVSSAISSDAGVYECRATNAIDTSTDSTRLDVSGSIPVVSLPTTLYERTYGQNVTMQCSVTATPDITEVRWQRFVNGAYQDIFTQSSTKYYGSSITNFALTVTNLVFTDAGEYRCTATNQVGRGVSPNRATLSVLGGQPTPFIPLTSYSVLIGNDIQIPCTVSANPAATLIQWQFTSNSGSSTPISQSTTKYTLVGDSTTTSNLTINSAALTDAGTYRCSATNIVGTGSDSATLTITGNAATVTVSPPSQSVLQKSTAIIQCIINNANPGVTEVSWEKISSGTTSSVIVTGRFNGSTPSLPNLIISDLQPSDAGTYYCSARNAIGTSRSSTGSNLIVTGAVPNNVQIVGATSQTVNLGGSLTLQCSGQGNPAPTLSWIFSSSTSDATEVGTGTTYSITNAQRTNGGTYVCRGTNSLGSTDSQGVTVDVQYAPIDARTDAQKSLTAAVGSTVSLVCAVDANPVASYEWYRNSQPVSNQRQYTFTLSSPDLVGSYTCKATNSRGSVELLYTLSQGNAGNTGASTATSGLSTGEIAAIILAVLLLLILIIIIIICCLTHGACGVICGKKQDVKGRVEPEKEVYKETQKEVIIPRFHEESIKGKRQPSAVSRKDVDIRVQNGGFRRENDYEIVRYETVPAAPPISTQYITESPRPHHLPALSYTYEDVEKKRKKRRKKKKHHHRRHHGEAEEVVVETVRSASPVRIIQEPVEEVVVERVIRSRSASPTRVIRTEAEEPTVVERVIRSSSPTRVYRQDIEEPVIIETRRSTRSPQRYRRESDEEMIIERRSPSTKRRYEENYITEERYSSGDVVQDDGDLRAYNGVVYREAPSRHSGGHYRVHGSERRSRSRSGRRERGSDDDVEVVYGKEYVVER